MKPVPHALPDRPSDRSRRRCVVALGLAWVAPAGAVLAQEAAPTPDAEKAAYLLRFPGYVDWPAGTFPAADTPVVIGVAGAPGVVAELNKALARTAPGRPVRLRVLEADGPVEGLHLLFVGSDARSATAAWAARVQGRPVLLVADGPDGLGAGAMINFMTVQGRLRFEAAPAVAEAAQLKISSRLLGVAERIGHGP